MLVKLYFCGLNPCWDGTVRLGVRYLKSNCESYDTQIEIITNRNDLKDCDLIGLSAHTSGIPEALRILESTRIPIVLGGHSSTYHKIEEYGFAHIVRGDGELIFRDIITGNTKDRIVSREIEDIDTIIFPWRGNMVADERTFLCTSRGCIYGCTFCSLKNFRKFQQHSAEYVVDDIKDILRHSPNMRMLDIIDDCFTISKTRLNRIRELWEKENLRSEIKEVWCTARVSDINDDFMDMIKPLNVTLLKMGFESFSDEALRKLKKGHTAQDCQKALDTLYRRGVKVRAMFMFNFPGETRADRRKTKQFIDDNRIKIERLEIREYQPIPGAQLYNGEDVLKDHDMNLKAHTTSDVLVDESINFL